jgi:hypothetical protein
MCPAKSSVLRTNLRVLLRPYHSPAPADDLPQQFPIKIFIKKLNRLNCWSTLRPTNPRDASFSALRL